MNTNDLRSHTGHRRVWRYLFAAVVMLVLLLAPMLMMPRTKHWHEDSGNIFGTSYHIKYTCSYSLRHLVALELEKVDRTFSIFNPNSLVSRLNAGETDSVNSLFREVFIISKNVFKDTGGAFDPTVRPAVEAWGFGKSETPALPPFAVDSLRRLIGFQKVSLDGVVLKRPAGTTLDFGAIAKGYAVDRVARILESHGVSDYMIEIGGELRMSGHNPDGQMWTVGIVSPPAPGQGADVFIQPETLQMTSGAVATSGNYNNARVINGKKYSHTINPRTATPQLSDVLSATVIAPQCAIADAYATAFMVLGKAESDKILSAKDTTKLRAILITSFR